MIGYRGGGALVTCRACRAVFSGGGRDGPGCVSHIWNSSCRGKRVERRSSVVILSRTLPFGTSPCYADTSLSLFASSSVSWTSMYPGVFWFFLLYFRFGQGTHFYIDSLSLSRCVTVCASSPLTTTGPHPWTLNRLLDST